MSTAAQLPDIDSLPHEPLPARKTRGVYVGFATMVTIGLALGGWYVGNRILAADGVHASSTPQMVIAQTLEAAPPAVEAPAAAPQAATAIQQLPAHDAPPEALLPLALEYYLQIAALGTAQDVKYMQQLQSKGLKARLENAAGNHESQILVGPYPDRAALRRVEARLAASGVLGIETVR